MKIAVTGGTGFIGRYLIRELLAAGHQLRCWHRTESDLSGIPQDEDLQWQVGELGSTEDAAALVADCDAVVHSALYCPGAGFRGGEGDLIVFAEKNVLGSLKLMEAARTAGVNRFVYISTCAVHEKILDDRPLDEAHPLWSVSHYGAHKAAVEKFVHSYGLGHGYPVCALRPTGVYGAMHNLEQSKWFELVQKVSRGETVNCTRGGKEVHAADVAKATKILLNADEQDIIGEAFACYDQYISQWDVAHLAKELSGSNAEITGQQTRPKHQIETGKLRVLGMEFGAQPLLRETVQELLERTA